MGFYSSNEKMFRGAVFSFSRTYGMYAENVVDVNNLSRTLDEASEREQQRFEAKNR